MKIIIDASSWIEYLEGSQSGEKLNKILKENQEEVYVLPITISEVVSKVSRKNNDLETAYNIIIKNSNIIQTTPRMAKDAGMLHAEIRKKNDSFGIVDALLITAAKSLNFKIITCDNHFKSFKEAIIL